MRIINAIRNTNINNEPSLLPPPVKHSVLLHHGNKVHNAPLCVYYDAFRSLSVNVYVINEKCGWCWPIFSIYCTLCMLLVIRLSVSAYYVWMTSLETNLLTIPVMHHIRTSFLLLHQNELAFAFTFQKFFNR